MAEALFITIDDLRTHVGSEIGDARALALVEDAVAIVRQHPSVGDWTYADGSDKPVPQILKTVTKQVAARMWRNPTGARQETTGPFSTTYASADVAALTDTEYQHLSRLGGESPSGGGLWTLGTTRGELEVTDWRPVEGGGDPVPMFDERRPW